MRLPAVFVAYPSQPPEIGQAIEAAVRLLRRRPGSPSIRTWPESDVAGQFIASRVLESIDANDILVADITTPNFNVTFEIGFAIARAKGLLLIRHEPLASQTPTLSEVGLFDTIGYMPYENSEQISDLIHSRLPTAPLPLPPDPLNQKAPVYLVEARYKTDAVTRIVSRVKKARLRFRSFDPGEQPRLSAFEAISQVAQSYGVLLHLLPSRITDSVIHNLRAAFLAGLAYGLSKVLLLLQEGEEPVPLDYRDIARPFFTLAHIDDAVAEFAANVTEAFQASDARRVALPASFLATLTLGASSAENEFTTLGDYYLRTDAFLRTRRGEARLVVGRKGSGKSALFFQVRDDLRRQGSYVILDLKPDGYQLLKFKDSVLAALEPGTLEHTITAFWEYLLWLEICRKLLENDRQRHLRDTRLLGPYRRLAEAYAADEYIAEGDFSERMSELLQRIRDDFNVKFREKGSGRLSQPQVTEIAGRRRVVSEIQRGDVVAIGQS